MSPITLRPIGVIHSPYREKFAIPRQPNLVSAAHGTLELEPEFGHPDTVRGIEQFSHLWLSFVFHKHLERDWQPLVRPPRLGGNAKLGVYATRSTFRPNPLGLSVVKLERVEIQGKRAVLHLSGMDLLDGTPVLDIKPYVPYADSHPDAAGGFADGAPEHVLSVSFSPQAKQQLTVHTKRYPELELFITQVLSQDPRPAYQRKANSDKHRDRVYGVQLYDLDVRFQIHGEQCTVIELVAG